MLGKTRQTIKEIITTGSKLTMIPLDLLHVSSVNGFPQLLR